MTTVPKRIPWTPSQVVVSHPSIFTKGELEAYESEILANSGATESDASLFFERFPKFLLLGQGNEVRREIIIPSSDYSSGYRVDFLRRSYGRKSWDIVELKDPSKPFIVQTKKLHARFSAAVNAAISQAQDYRDAIIENPSIQARLLEKGIHIARPQILVVVGRSNQEVPDETVCKLIDRVNGTGIDARSYSDIFRFAKDHYESNRVIVYMGDVVCPADLYDFWAEELDEFLATLDEKEEKILRLRFGLGDGYPRSHDELAAVWNITPSAVKKLQTQGMKKLREANLERHIRHCSEARAMEFKRLYPFVRRPRTP